MSDNQNLELDFVPARDGGAEEHPDATARVYIRLVCGYLSGDGQATITADCTSFDELAAEISRLKRECDAILSEAATRFEDSGAPGQATAAGQKKPSAGEPPPPGSDKTRLQLGQDLRVADRMTRDARTIGRNDKLAVADELMKSGHFRHVVVVEDDGNDVVGIVSQRDMFYGALAWSLGQGAAAHERALNTIPVKEVMQTTVTTVTSETPLGDAARTMLEGRIGCLPVVDDGRLVGILTEGDFLAMLTETVGPA
jgi:CBS domain-containing membrane protein